MPRFFDYAP